MTCRQYQSSQRLRQAYLVDAHVQLRMKSQNTEQQARHLILTEHGKDGLDTQVSDVEFSLFFLVRFRSDDQRTVIILTSTP